MNDKTFEGSLSPLERSNVAVVMRMFNDIWNDKQMNAIEEIFSNDFISHQETEIIRGIENWKKMFYIPMVTAIPDITIEIEDCLPRNNYVVCRWKSRGTHEGELLGLPPSKHSIEFSGIVWLRLHDSKVIESWNGWSMSYLFKQLISEVKTLREIIPLCSFCKKIRNDKGFWEQVDVYIHKYSQADISHGVCPECLKKYYSIEKK